MDYGFVHEDKVFTPNGAIGVSPEENAARNEAIQAAERERWNTVPACQLAYYHFPWSHTPRQRQRLPFEPSCTGAYVTLWPGARIGTITSARVYWHNFGGRIVTMQVTGSNGAHYYGRASWDNGTCISLRKVKS